MAVDDQLIREFRHGSQDPVRRPKTPLQIWLRLGIGRQAKRTPLREALGQSRLWPKGIVAPWLSLIVPQSAMICKPVFSRS
jgi:hypothetical protein